MTPHNASRVTRITTSLVLAAALVLCVAGSSSAQETADRSGWIAGSTSAQEIGERSGWSRRDWILQSTYTALHVIDWSQSLSIARDPERREANPFLGPHPSEAQVHAYFGGTLAAHWAISAMLPPKARGVWQCFTIVFEGKSVARNFAVGVRLSFP